MDERSKWHGASDYIIGELRKIERLSAADEDPGALTEADEFLRLEGQEVFGNALHLKFATMARAEAIQAAWDCLLAHDDVDGARPHMARALEWYEIIRQVDDFGGFSLPGGALETAARKHGISPADARAWRSKNTSWAAFWMDVGREMERRKHSGQKLDLETFLAELHLAAQAEREGVTSYRLMKHLPDEKEARKRGQGARRARQRVQERISANR
jgi:hypothetical protein